jgi:hypothetical protein
MNHLLFPKGLTGSVLLMAMSTMLAGVAGAQGIPLEELGKAPPTVGAQGEPQILGVVASNGALPFTCDGDGCRADLSTFCLQQARENPGRGQSYVPVAGADIFLSGVDRAGRPVRMPAAPYVGFAADRGFTAVEATVSRETLAELGLSKLAIEIGATVSLLPAAAAADGDPQTAAEIAIATGSFRANAAAFFDREDESGDAIRLTNRMINALRAHSRSPADADGRVLDAALASAAGRTSGLEGMALTRRIYVTCREKVEMTHHFDNVRSCLEAAHDRLVANINIDFWRSLGSY